VDFFNTLFDEDGIIEQPVSVFKRQNDDFDVIIPQCRVLNSAGFFEFGAGERHELPKILQVLC